MYEIIEVLNDVPGKYTCMVSFNGKPAERYEVESLDPQVIDAVLTEVSTIPVVSTEATESIPV